VPNVETFAPLITAAFAPMEASHPGHRIRVRLADLGLAQVNPLLDTVATGESPILSPPGFRVRVVVFWIQLISQATGVWVCLQAAAYSAGVR
jgi:hypothetical protein